MASVGLTGVPTFDVDLLKASRQPPCLRGKATEKALRDWCRLHSIEIID